MSVFLKPVVSALGLSALCAASAVAQGAPKECSVQEGRPAAVGRATLAVQIASSAEPAQASRKLTEAVKALTDNGDKMDNQVGRNYVLGKALVLWSLQPNITLMSKRGPLGYATNPDATIDLAAAIDSAFQVVEKANPECITETSRWRGQKGWVNLVNKAIERLNADDADSAEASARSAILMNPYAPYGYVVLANVMQKRNKPSDALALYKKSVEIAARDTSYDDIKHQSLVYLGNLAADSAESAADPAARKPYVDMAKQAFDQLLADKGASEFAANARAGMCRLAVISGDTASLRITYKDPLEAPARFAYQDLMNAGVCLARAEMLPAATILFGAAYEKNKFHRDALSNFAIMLLRADKQREAIPYATRLAQVEPNNPENLQLLVLAYAGIAKQARDLRQAAIAKPATSRATKSAPATKTAAVVPKMSQATQDSLFKIEQAYSDSAFKANDKKEKLPFRVTLSDFSTSDDKATIAGVVVNQGTSAKDGVKVKVDFLDAEGNVVQTKEQVIGTIAAGGSGRFSMVASPGKGIASFRYAPLE
jgi:tetratricopeptide (TPR) repeat protein